MNSDEEVIRQAYEAFNARNIEAVLTVISPEVVWANGMEGGYVYGHTALRDYWSRQWQMINPHVEPLSLTREAGGQVRVVVHQVVRDMAGTILDDRNVVHLYQIDNGLVQRMDIVKEMEFILWRGFVLPGHEACQLFFQASHWHLEGTAVFSHEQRPCRLDYQIMCDEAWRTLSAKVDGWLGNTLVGIHIRTNATHAWWLNEVEQPDLKGCVDLDLNFSPSTNLLPIRRLDLAVGEAAEVKAAWLRFPSFRLELLPQQYRRLDETTYRYESAGGQFVADLKVNPSGFVMDYPGLWQSEATSA
jgi:uncharacterized protein